MRTWGAAAAGGLVIGLTGVDHTPGSPCGPARPPSCWTLLHAAGPCCCQLPHAPDRPRSPANSIYEAFKVCRIAYAGAHGGIKLLNTSAVGLRQTEHQGAARACSPRSTRTTALYALVKKLTVYTFTMRWPQEASYGSSGWWHGRPPARWELGCKL
jgi:hypothetical protein